MPNREQKRYIDTGSVLKRLEPVDSWHPRSGITEKGVVEVHDGEGVAPAALVDLDSSPDDDAFVAEVGAEAVGERMQAEILEDENCEAIWPGDQEATETAVTSLLSLSTSTSLPKSPVGIDLLGLIPLRMASQYMLWTRRFL